MRKFRLSSVVSASVAGAMVLLLGLAPGDVAAAPPIVKPYTFAPNTPARASEVNADFDSVYTAVNDLEKLAPLAAGFFYAWDETSLVQALADADAVTAADPAAFATVWLMPTVFYLTATVVLPRNTTLYGFGAILYDATGTVVPLLVASGTGFNSLNEMVLVGAGDLVHCDSGRALSFRHGGLSITASQPASLARALVGDNCYFNLENENVNVSGGIPAIAWLTAGSLSSTESSLSTYTNAGFGYGILANDASVFLRRSDISISGVSDGISAVDFGGTSGATISQCRLSADTSSSAGLAFALEIGGGTASITLTQTELEASTPIGQSGGVGSFSCYGNFGGTPIAAINCP